MIRFSPLPDFIGAPKSMAEQNLKVWDLFFFGLPCRSDRAYCSLSVKKLYAAMSLYVADMFATF